MHNSVLGDQTQVNKERVQGTNKLWVFVNICKYGRSRVGQGLNSAVFREGAIKSSFFLIRVNNLGLSPRQYNEDNQLTVNSRLFLMTNLHKRRMVLWPRIEATSTTSWSLWLVLLPLGTA